MDDTRFALGSRFAEERKRSGMTQGVLAGVCGVDRKTIGNVERGANAPSAELLMHVAERGMDVQYILTGVRSQNSDLVAEERGNYHLSPVDHAKRSLNVALEAVEALGLKMGHDQLKALVGYAYETHATRDTLIEFIRSAYAVTGRPLESIDGEDGEKT